MDHLYFSSSTISKTTADSFLVLPPFSRHAFPSLSMGILGLIALLYIGTCFTPVIFDDNEGLYAGSVREMRHDGNWLVPMSNGFPRVQKPPLVYWIMLVTTEVFGENEFALRLSNACATVGWIVATYLIARCLGGERFGLVSSLVLASMLGVWVFNHLVQPEPYLACFISLSFWCLIEASARSTIRESWYSRFWVFMALGVLSKGLHGAIWPLATVGFTALFFPGSRPWLRPVLSGRGALLFALLVVPWYTYMAFRFPHFLRAHFMNEQLGASLNCRYPADARQLPLVQFYAQHLLFWLPWTLLIPGAIYVAVKKRCAWREQPPDESFATADSIRLLTVWVAVTLTSVAFSTRQDYYSMSCWGVVATFLALPWMSGESSFLPLPRWYLLGPSLLLALAGVAALVLAWVVRARLGTLGQTTAAPLGERDTFMDALAGISPALWAHFLVLLAVFGLALLAGGVFASLWIWRGRSFVALLILSGTMAVPVILSGIGFTMMSPYFSLAEEARAINREIEAEPEAVVACEALPNTASSLFYYLNKRVHWVNAPFNNQYAQQELGLGRDYYWDQAGLLTAWHANHPVYLILEESRTAYWASLLPHARVVKRSGTRIVWCNH